MWKGFRKSLSDSFGVASIAPGRDFGATARGIPRGLSPFDAGMIGCHDAQGIKNRIYAVHGA